MHGVLTSLFVIIGLLMAVIVMSQQPADEQEGSLSALKMSAKERRWTVATVLCAAALAATALAL